MTTNQKRIPKSISTRIFSGLAFLVLTIIAHSYSTNVTEGASGSLLGQQTTDPLGRPTGTKKQGKGKAKKNGARTTESKDQGDQQTDLLGQAIENKTKQGSQSKTEETKQGKDSEKSSGKQKKGGMTTKDARFQGLPPIRPAKGPKIDQPHGVFRLIKRSENIWEFGVEVQATGPTLGLTVTAPVPIEWAEQKVKLISLDKSPEVKSVKFKKHGKLAKQMIVKIPRLAGGRTAKAVVTMKLTRFDIVSPEELPKLQFAKKGDVTGAKFLRPSPYIESNHKRIKELAAQFNHPELPPFQQVEKIYEWIQKNIEYRFDPQIHTCIEALDSKIGDCEEVASLFVAICRAKGIPARAVWCNSHTYPEFMLKTASGKSVWIPCEITSFEHVFGQVYGDHPILQKGDRFKVPGYRKEKRYIVPTLQAKRATGSPMLKWISRKAVPKKEKTTNESPLGSPPSTNKNPLK